MMADAGGEAEEDGSGHSGSSGEEANELQEQMRNLSMGMDEPEAEDAAESTTHMPFESPEMSMMCETDAVDTHELSLRQDEDSVSDTDGDKCEADISVESTLLPLASLQQLSLEDEDTFDEMNNDDAHTEEDVLNVIENETNKHALDTDAHLHLCVTLNVSDSGSGAITVSIILRDSSCFRDDKSSGDQVSVHETGEEVEVQDEDEDEDEEFDPPFPNTAMTPNLTEEEIEAKLLKKPIRFVMRSASAGSDESNEKEQSKLSTEKNFSDSDVNSEKESCMGGDVGESEAADNFVTRSIISGSGVGIIYDPIMALHLSPEVGHVECPERITTIYSKLALDDGENDSSIMDKCFLLKSREAYDNELLLAHTLEHVKTIEANSRAVSENGVSFGDIYFNNSTNMAARMATGCVIEACERVIDGTIRAALAIVRPPGHHAECAREMGFCFFNNVAVAALQLLKYHSETVKKVLIVDWDVHHGNGIQHILEDRDDVMYVSLHRFTQYFYPGTGSVEEVGHGTGRGSTVNIPWECTGLNDADYLAAFDLIIEPIVKQFAPDIIIVSAGFDAVDGDPLGGMCVSPEGYAHMTHRLQALSKNGRLVLALEGGYNVQMNAICVRECMKVLLGQTIPDLKSRLRIRSTTEKTLLELAEMHSQFCSELRSQSWQRRAQETFADLHKATPKKSSSVIKSRAVSSMSSGNEQFDSPEGSSFCEEKPPRRSPRLAVRGQRTDDN